MSTILIVDDDQNLLKMLQRTLVYEGLRVVTASNGREALAQVSTHQPDIIILDWMMPRMDALENRVDGLESGADDYLTKPFAPEELVARVHALLRRVASSPSKQSLTFNDLSLDPVQHKARRGEIVLDLTPTEFDLLHYFMRHPRQVLERAQILNSVWGYEFSGDDNVLEVYVGYLRRKLEASREPRLIHTVRGIGYVLRAE